jgi:UDP-N-acetyl-alpha-D-quinovosamine dehydrogenase
MQVLILGGTGFCGRALVEHLQATAPGVDLTVVSRTATSLPGVGSVMTGHYGDLARSAAFRRKLEGVEVVVHLADGLSVLQQRRHAGDATLADELMAATVRLAVAARAARVPRLVHVSSIKAICGEDDARLLTEADEPRPNSLYGRSKLWLEQSLAALLKGSDTRLTVVRTPLVYGPGRAGNSLSRLLELADTGLPLPLAGLANRRSLLAVPNLAGALAAVVRAGPGAPDGVFHVHDGPALSTTEIVGALRTGLGRPCRLFPAGAAVSAVARQLPLIGATARRLFGSLELCDAHFRRTFGCAPVVETGPALAALAKAYLAELSRDVIGTAVPSAR